MHTPGVEVLRASQPPSTVTCDRSVEVFVVGESLTQCDSVQHGCVRAGCGARRCHVRGVANHHDAPGRDSISAEVVLWRGGERVHVAVSVAVRTGWRGREGYVMGGDWIGTCITSGKSSTDFSPPGHKPIRPLLLQSHMFPIMFRCHSYHRASS